MNALCRRHPRERLLQSFARVAMFGLAIVLLAIVWAAVRAPLLYRLARANFGNHQCVALIDRALVERHPDLAQGASDDDGIPDRWQLATASFDTGRRKFAIRTLDGQQSFSEGSRVWLLFDNRLDRIGSFRGQFGAALAPDDRDGDGSIELTSYSWLQSSPNTSSMTYCVIRMGRARHSLIAAVNQTIGTGTTSAPTVWASPQWTNDDRDERHELDWITGFGPGFTVTSVFKLRWLAPGRMTYDGPLPAGYKVWLAESPDQVTFDPDKPLDEVVRRVMGAQ